MSYRFIEHTADIAVEVESITIQDLFAFACHAWRDAALESNDVPSTEIKSISVSGNSYEELLIQLLSELNYLLYVEKWVFNSVESIIIGVEGTSLKLIAEFFGDIFNSEEYNLKDEIKAITYHQAEIQKKGDLYMTRIVFDI